MLKTLLKEPLLHFMLIAATLFGAASILQPADENTLYLSRSVVQYLEEDQQTIRLRSLSQQEKNDIADNYIKEEILLREARALGLDSDVRIRNQLIRKMRFLMLETIEAPVEADLEDFYADNISLFTRQPSLILEHLFYREMPAQPIHELVSQTDKMQLKGDFHTMLGSRIDGITEDELSSIIGLLAAQQIFQQPLSQWSQAIKSDSGYHFVKIEQRLPLATTSFDEARDYIKSDWLKLQQERLVDDKVSKLQAKYQIHWIEDAVASQIDPQS